MTNKRYVGIVGSSKAVHNERSVRAVMNVLERYDSFTTIIVSGGAVGIDRIAVDIANQLGYEVLEYMPKGIGWQYYKPRNDLIAKRCDKVYSIALPLSFHPKTCHHCKRAGRDDNHYKTAGCYTGSKCKEYEVVIIEG